MRKGYILDSLTLVDIREVVKNGRKLIEKHESFIYRENYKISPFRTVIEKLYRSWTRSRKTSFNNGIIKPTKMRRCSECKDGIICKNKINENKEFEANINLSKREAPHEFGFKLPYYKK